MTPKRKKIIKIRVSDIELEMLRNRCTDIYLAKWMREVCLNERKVKKRRKSQTDPDLLFQLSAIGNNLNQIARVVNSEKWKPIDRIAVCVQLQKIETSISRLLRTD